jgi:hypothetical protein
MSSQFDDFWVKEEYAPGSKKIKKTGSIYASSFLYENILIF